MKTSELKLKGHLTIPAHPTSVIMSSEQINENGAHDTGVTKLAQQGWIKISGSKTKISIVPALAFLPAQKTDYLFE